MGIQSRSLLQQEFERQLERSNPIKVKLTRARPYNCVGGTCFSNGRQSIDENCPVCNGTGYLTGVAGADNTVPPYSDTYLIYGDVQTGHGLYGAGGDYLKLMVDIGKESVGDATLFSKYKDVDRVTGKIIFPLVDAGLPRPDRITSLRGVVYNIVREIILEVGSDTIGRAFTLEEGSFSAISLGGR